jgi:hypothetical protein
MDFNFVQAFPQSKNFALKIREKDGFQNYFVIGLDI